MTPEQRRNRNLEKSSERLTKVLERAEIDKDVLELILALNDQQTIRLRYIEEKLQDISETLNQAVLRNILK